MFLMPTERKVGPGDDDLLPPTSLVTNALSPNFSKDSFWTVNGVGRVFNSLCTSASSPGKNRGERPLCNADADRVPHGEWFSQNVGENV